MLSTSHPYHGHEFTNLGMRNRLGTKSSQYKLQVWMLVQLLIQWLGIQLLQMQVDLV